MTRTGSDAIQWARDHGNANWHNLCLMFVRMAFDRPGGTATARLAWLNADHRHHTSDPNSIPRGVPVFWDSSSYADHIALSIGDGKCISTDALSGGRAAVVGIGDLTRRWNMTLWGWSEDLNGGRVWTPPKPDPPKHPTPFITAALKADDPAERLAALRAVAKHNDDAAHAAEHYIDLIHRRLRLSDKVDDVRAVLKRLEVK